MEYQIYLDTPTCRIQCLSKVRTTLQHVRRHPNLRPPTFKAKIVFGVLCFVELGIPTTQELASIWIWARAKSEEDPIMDEERLVQCQPLLPMPVKELWGVWWIQFHNTRVAPQHLSSHHSVLEPVRNFVQHFWAQALNLLRGQITDDERLVEAKAMPTIVTQAGYRLVGCMETVSQHSEQGIKATE